MTLRTYKNCPAALESYLRYLELVENKAASTLDGRCVDIRNFLKFLRSRCEGVPSPEEIAAGDIFVANMNAETIAAVTEDDIEDYLEYLMEERRMSQETIYRRKLTALRDFYNYMLRQQVDLGVVMLSNPVPLRTLTGETAPATPCRVLTHSEIDRVLKAVDGSAAVRDVAIIMLIATTGISANEVVKIRYKDYSGDSILVAGRKVHLTQSVQKAIRLYLMEYRDPIEEFLKDNTLFVSRSKLKRLSGRGLRYALQQHFNKAGVDGSAQDLRHTAVMELLKNARNECERAYLAGYLGYTNPSSIARLDLPKFSDDEPVPQLIADTWLNNLGKRS